jgi:hypothetical protein
MATASTTAAAFGNRRFMGSPPSAGEGNLLVSFGMWLRFAASAEPRKAFHAAQEAGENAAPTPELKSIAPAVAQLARTSPSSKCGVLTLCLFNSDPAMVV